MKFSAFFFLDCLKFIYKHKLATFFMVISLTIAITIIASLLSISLSLNRTFIEMVSQMGFGADSIFILPGRGGMFRFRRPVYNLTENDRLLIEMSPLVDYSSGMVNHFGTLRYRNNIKDVHLMGVNHHFPLLDNTPIAQGRFFTREENESKQRLIVLGHDIARELFEEDKPLGKFIQYEGLNFQVIGIIEERGMAGPQNLDEQAFVSEKLLKENILQQDNYMGIRLRLISPDVMEKAQDELELILRESHNMRPEEEFGFRFFTAQALAEIVTETARQLLNLLVAVMLVSLFIAGIIIMNIMLISVSQRSQEIGIRKSFGASFRHIMIEYLLETIIVALVGAVLGLLLSSALAFFIGVFTPLNPEISGPVILFAIFFSVIIGLFFGILPAYRAATKDPVDALRK